MNKYNLQELLTGELEIESAEDVIKIKFDGVRIPMIQRDYAQGRLEEKEVRGRFLAAIFEALVKEADLELDFVYGSVKIFDDAKYFIPLDGQQRLTTLFLLNWYLGQREISDPEQLKAQQAGLKRFSYDTRATARKFCESICTLGRIDSSKSPSVIIKDASWFYSAFEKDPTVKGMLNMLDDIHDHYKLAQGNLYTSLSRLKFYILPLDGFGLSDELYIKMNARGKQLTDFENFKADLIKWMKDVHNKEHALFTEEIVYNGRKMPYYMTISLKLDNEWTNFFWGFTRNAEKEEDKLIDPLFLRFINRYLLNSFVLNSPLTLEALEKSDEFQFLYGQDKKDSDFKYSNFAFYQPLIGSYSTIKKLEQVLDNFAQHFLAISQVLPASWEPADKWRCFDKEISQTQRILFHGMCGFAQHTVFNLPAFKQWIRVVWNIIINPDIRSIPAMITAMKLIQDLSPDAGHIYDFLSGDASLPLVNAYKYTEYAEEREKAKLIATDPQWENALIAGEKHPLFQGNVGFLLSGQPGIDQFMDRVNLAGKLFGKNGARDSFATGHRLMRATISKVGRFHDLLRIKMEDSDRNWNLLLRRNEPVRRIICNFCGLGAAAAMNEAITASVSDPSNISWDDPAASNRRIRFVHQQLYQPAAFHGWMQKHYAVDLVPRDDHYYIKRKSAWYDFVMLDTCRNEMISELAARFDLKTNNQCDHLDFYWGYGVETQVAAFKFVVSLDFDHLKTIRVGLRRDRNFIGGVNLTSAAAESDANWWFVKCYDYSKVVSREEMLQLVEQITIDIFDTSLPESLYSQLKAMATKDVQNSA